MSQLQSEVISLPLVRPETALQASACLHDLCLHVGRVLRGGSDSGIRAAMVSDGADQGKSDHFVYSWVMAVMPQLDDAYVDRVIAITEDAVGQRLTLVLAPYFRTQSSYRLTMDLPAAFWRLEEDARWTSNS